MSVIRGSIIALLISSSAAFAFPIDEVPTDEAAFLAKVKTAAPEQIVAKATIRYDERRQADEPANRHQRLHLHD